MSLQSPRIYTYKITFEEVPYYYYGMHEEKVYDEEYWGSPQTHKWCWELYTPKKQILETFSSREDAGQVERRLIKPVYNTDKWCLNESCGGAFSLDTCSRAGKIAGQKTYEMKVGVHNRTEEQRQIDAKKGGLVGGKLAYQMKVGVHNRTEEQRKIDAKKGGLVGGKLVRELGVGIHGRTKEQKIEDGRKGIKITNSQKWECLETGFITNPGNLTQYQRAKGIDTSKRKRIS
jgi:hypothetical protein